LRDLRRYMGLLGAKVAGPHGEPWRAGKRPYGRSALSTAAACLKGFYVHQASLGVNRELGDQLARTRLPTQADRRRQFLGHLSRELPANPLAPPAARRRHPKMLPEGARDRLPGVVSTARDRLVITWLSDGGFRVGELCGLHFADLHLREDAGCGECRAPHVHVCHRAGNPNRAAAKTKPDWSIEDGTVCGGLVKRVSPAMVHTYFEYLTSEYPRPGPGHGMLLVQLAVIAETLRAGLAAGVDDATLATTLRESAMMPAGLRKRIDVFFDPDHAGWFSTVQGTKDVTLFLDLVKGSGVPLPVTEAARDAYRQVVQDGWETHDVTALVEYGWRSP